MDENGEVLTLNANRDNMLTLCLATFIERQREWSQQPSPNGFGPGCRLEGVCKHIESELAEIRSAKPKSLELLVEWCDVIILALDGAWRGGFSPDMICQMLMLKSQLNHSRQWPPAPPDQPSMHAKEDVATVHQPQAFIGGYAAHIGSPPPPRAINVDDVRWMGHVAFIVYWEKGDSCQLPPSKETIRDAFLQAAFDEWDASLLPGQELRYSCGRLTGDVGFAWCDTSQMFPPKEPAPKPRTYPDDWRCEVCGTGNNQTGKCRSCERPYGSVVGNFVCCDCGRTLSCSGIERLEPSRCKACTAKREE